MGEEDLKVAEEGVCDKGGESVGGLVVEAFKVVLLAPWSSQTTPRDVTRCPIPKLVTRLSFSESTSASNSCRTYAWVALATPTSPANRSSETCRNAGLAPAPTPTPIETRS